MARIVLADFFGLWRVCGSGVALRWLANVGLRFRQCVRERNLQPVDRAMGQGPFAVRTGASRARLAGEQVISGIREIWVRGVYLGDDGFVRISPGDTVVDLGSNMGTFAILALGHGDGVRVVAVEPSAVMRERMRHSLAENGWTERVRVCDCFIGGFTDSQRDALRQREYQSAGTISQEELIERYGLTRIDFLKCDIEGSEFDLFRPGSPLLAVTRQLAMEVHDAAGSRTEMSRRLEEAGFEVRVYRSDPDTCILQARRRDATATRQA